MELKEGYKQTEVGVIPEDWEVVFIENIAEIKTGDKNTQDKNPSGRYPFFVRSQNVERIDSYSFDCEAVLTAGDGVGTGKVFHYINSKFDVHQRVYVIYNFSDKILGYFFFLYFSSHFYNRIMQMTAKSSVDSVRREMIAEMPIALPQISEQLAISTALSDVDALLSSLDTLIVKKRGIKMAAMQALLTGKKRLPGFSGEWVEKTLSTIAMIVGGGTPSTAEPSYWNGSIPWFTPAEINTTCKYVSRSEKNISEVGLKKSSAKLLPIGTILLTTRASIGFRAILTVSAATNQGFQSLIIQNDTNNEFIYYLLGIIQPELAAQASGSTFLEISPRKLGDIPLRLPPSFAEQAAIAAVLSDMDAEIAALEARRAKVQALKQGMMQELLTGRMRLLPEGEQHG